jgi:hypothetical protein
MSLDAEEEKKLLKQAIKEWMNDQFAAFGRMTFYGLLSAAFAGLVYLALVGAGWHK